VDAALVGLIELAYSIATLALVAAGLALVFGLMRIINLAHGEFVVLGGYATIIAAQHGVNIWLAIVVVAPLAVGAFGLVVEWLVIRRLYGRMIDTMLATWGLSLAMAGAFSMIFGATTTGVSNPLGAVSIGDVQFGGYGLFVIGVSVVLFVVAALVLRFTRAGLVVRGAMQSSEVAAALGHDPRRVYQFTFVVGSMVSGLAGGVLAPLTGLSPSSGGQFIAKAFITVIGGGASVVSGTLAASALFGTVAKMFEVLTTPMVGEIALLVTAVLLLRVLPQGITSRWFKGWA
jgi:branched-chain amino acid transport system permease protein